MSSIAHLNGHFMRADQCEISALDGGFAFGDAIYEVIPACEGRGFAVAGHIERLSDNLAKVNVAEHIGRLSDSLAKVNTANPHSEATY